MAGRAYGVHQGLLRCAMARPLRSCSDGGRGRPHRASFEHLFEQAWYTGHHGRQGPAGRVRTGRRPRRGRPARGSAPGVLVPEEHHGGQLRTAATMLSPRNSGGGSVRTVASVASSDATTITRDARGAPSCGRPAATSIRSQRRQRRRRRRASGSTGTKSSGCTVLSPVRPAARPPRARPRKTTTSTETTRPRDDLQPRQPDRQPSTAAGRCCSSVLLLSTPAAPRRPVPLGSRTMSADHPRSPGSAPSTRAAAAPARSSFCPMPSTPPHSPPRRSAARSVRSPTACSSTPTARRCSS